MILVGDPDQLSSVEAGAVLADLVDGLGARGPQIAALTTSHRFGESIGLLADAIRPGDDDRVLELLRAGGEHIEFVDTDDPASRLREVLVPHATSGAHGGRRAGRSRPHWPRWTSTACCARTGKGRAVFGTGTVSWNAG